MQDDDKASHRSSFFGWLRKDDKVFSSFMYCMIVKPVPFQVATIC